MKGVLLHGHIKETHSLGNTDLNDMEDKTEMVYSAKGSELNILISFDTAW